MINGLADGYRESTQSWHEMLLDLQRRSLTRVPDAAIGHGALACWIVNGGAILGHGSGGIVLSRAA